MNCFLYISFLSVFVSLSTQEGVVINYGNINHYLSTKKVMLLNFYADWCRYSSLLKPIYDKAADQIQSETDLAILGKVDCEVEKYVCQQMYHITKYPTVKIVRNGQVMKKEYRGKRSVEALVEFIRKELRDPIEVVGTTAEVTQKSMELSKCVLGEFPSNSSSDYSAFSQVASTLKDDCRFFAVFDSNTERGSVAFKENNNPDQSYTGDLTSADELQSWLSEKCLPMVREITFENGEEMTEEGLPFLIMFYHPDHPETKQTFRDRVMAEVPNEKGSVNFVTADGVRFAHPLSHLGKSKKDLPLIAIDSFKHMYVFPNYEDIHVPGKLKQFVEDLHSGKLHRDFHNAPHPEVHNPHNVQKRDVQQEQPNAPSDKGKPSSMPDKPSTPPESTFKKLQPARSRYTLLKHDEL